MKGKGLILGAAIVIVAMSTVLAGCGSDTKQANSLVREAGDLAGTAQDRMTEIGKLLQQASDQLTDGNIEEEKASLDQAQVLIDQTIADLESAKSKVDEAASLDISDAFRQYLEAKSKVMEGGVNMMNASRELTALLQADPGLERPETLEQVNALQEQVLELNQQVQAAEAEAQRIADENKDDIGTD
ncbi:hypothetical protein BMS3Abin01_01031 [bacterium BMS3Abin01]|nr:hypothetical protein BMS3Abin01_01031 [bacterium BMS3Abin01]HDY69715.1 hypothetical protein [Actinomycetota bacterium]